MSSLVVIPSYLREPPDLHTTVNTLASLRETEPAASVLVVDDGSPVRGLVDELSIKCAELGIQLHRKTENEGFSRAVNVGLKAALDGGMDAVLLNADIEFIHRGWLDTLEKQRDTQDRPASVVGALLIYPNGLIQHAGIYFSFLTRSFDHRYRYAPAELAEANVSARVPVTGALQFIRHECLTSIGLYDEDFRMGYEDVDYTLRVFASGRDCIYQPAVRAVHHESLFRGRADSKLNEWQNASWRQLMKKHQHTNMSEWVTEIV